MSNETLLYRTSLAIAGASNNFHGILLDPRGAPSGFSGAYCYGLAVHHR